MKNKEIQEQRMKGYFIQATKEILKGEGVKGLSVRNIADQAGYSFATLYNYFRDVNDLIFLCVSGFQDECREFAETGIKSNDDAREVLKEKVLRYIKYFVEYPGIFELFYLTRVGDFGNKQTTIGVIASSLEEVCKTEWVIVAQQTGISSEVIELKKAQLKYVVVGLLLFYLNRMIPSDYQQFIDQSKQQINNIIDF